MRGVDAGSLLLSTELFSNLEDDAVSHVASQLVTRVYRRGQPLFHQGDPATALFIVASGSIAVFVTSENGDRMVLNTLGPGDVLGEIALLDEGTRSASAEAVEATTVMALSRPAFLDLLRRHPVLVDQLLRSMGGLVRRLSERASDFVFLDLPGRVAKAVVRLTDETGSAAHAPGEITVTQGRLAEMVGGSRQSVNQILQNFASRGWVEVQGRKLVVRQPDLLRRRAGLL